MDTQHVIIVGAQKCGTTTIFNSLAAHPDIEAAIDRATTAVVKELYYFAGVNWSKGFDWYASHYACSKPYTLDGTPEYLSIPEAALRIAKIFPHAKIIVTLREPIRRLFSQFNHYIQDMPLSNAYDWQFPGESLQNNLKAEFTSPQIDWRGFLKRGHYAEQLQHLENQLSREQLMVLIFEEWTIDPHAMLEKVQEFLALPYYPLPITVAHRREYTSGPFDTALLNTLKEYYQLHNEALFDWLRREIFLWSEATKGD